jgi:hypothetical protein
MNSMALARTLSAVYVGGENAIRGRTTGNRHGEMGVCRFLRRISASAFSTTSMRRHCTGTIARFSPENARTARFFIAGLICFLAFAQILEH